MYVRIHINAYFVTSSFSFLLFTFTLELFIIMFAIISAVTIALTIIITIAVILLTSYSW